MIHRTSIRTDSTVSPLYQPYGIYIDSKLIQKLQIYSIYSVPGMGQCVRTNQPRNTESFAL